MKKSWLAIIGAFFLVHVFKRLKHKIDPRSYAGATFLGLKGFVVKTHGNSDALAFANAIQYASEFAKKDLNDIIGGRGQRPAWKHTDQCLSCFACVERCPRGVEPANIIEAVRLIKIRKQNANHLHAEQIPEMLDEDLPQQAIVSAFRKYKK